MIRFPYDLWKSIVLFLKNILTDFSKWGLNMITQARILEHRILDWAQNTFMSFVNTIWGWISQLPGMFLNMLTQVLGWLWNFAPQLASAALNIGVSIFQAIWGWIQQIPGKFLEILTKSVAWLVDKLPEFVSGAMDIGMGIFNGIIDFFTGLPGKVLEILTNSVNHIKNAASSAYSAAKSFGKGFWDGFKDGIGVGSPSYVERALMAIEAQAASTESNLKRSIISMNRTAASIPISSGSLGIATPAAVATSSYAWNQNAPLVGVANIRDRRDIYTLARDLEDERAKRDRARGLTTNGVK